MTPASPNNTPDPNGEKQSKKRNFWLWFLAIIFLGAAVGWLTYWQLFGRFYVYTEDAYTNGNAVMLTPQISAGVKAIYADETDLVQEGQLVVELDTTVFELKFEEVKKELAVTVRKVAEMFQEVEAKQAQIVLKKAQLRQAELDLNHRDPLIKTGAVSLEEYEIYQTSVAVAQASVDFAEKEYQAAQALVANTTVFTHPQVQQVIWNLKQIYLNLIRCQVWAPVTGYIAKRSVQVGDQVTSGTTLLYIVPLDEMWIEANYKETALKHVKKGQKVRFTADLYGDSVTYHGEVLGFQPGSGNAFSLLPPENASGNWIKIVQRIPIRISIDQDELRRKPLVLGLSMKVTIDIHETNGQMLAHTPTFTPLYTTDIYQKQVEKMVIIDPLIEDIISNNLFYIF
jgi:membrane fusion protein (multidrug efflux system)